jgi:hypothetical protein
MKPTLASMLLLCLFGPGISPQAFALGESAIRKLERGGKIE